MSRNLARMKKCQIYQIMTYRSRRSRIIDMQQNTNKRVKLISVLITVNYRIKINLPVSFFNSLIKHLLQIIVV